MTEALVQSLLTERGLTGCLANVSGDLWQLRGLKGSRGAAVEILGEPDELILTEAANIIASELVDGGDRYFAQAN